MKKIVLGLALCLGLSQVAVAEKPAVRGLSDDAKTYVAWMQNHPYKTAAIGVALLYTVDGLYKTGMAFMADKGKADKGKEGAASSETSAVEAKSGATTGTWSKVQTGFLDAAKDFSIKPVIWVAGKSVDIYKVVSESAKEHKALFIGIPSGVILLIAALVIADMETTEDGKETRAAQALKYFKGNKDVAVN